jgi:hypothetical protein
MVMILDQFHFDLDALDYARAYGHGHVRQGLWTPDAGRQVVWQHTVVPLLPVMAVVIVLLLSAGLALQLQQHLRLHLERQEAARA